MEFLEILHDLFNARFTDIRFLHWMTIISTDIHT